MLGFVVVVFKFQTLHVLKRLQTNDGKLCCCCFFLIPNLKRFETSTINDGKLCCCVSVCVQLPGLITKSTQANTAGVGKGSLGQGQHGLNQTDCFSPEIIVLTCSN